MHKVTFDKMPWKQIKGTSMCTRGSSYYQQRRAVVVVLMLQIYQGSPTLNTISTLCKIHSLQVYLCKFLSLLNISKMKI